MWIVLIILLVLSILGVLKAADIFVNNLSDLGTFFGVSDVVLGVTASNWFLT